MKKSIYFIEKSIPFNVKDLNSPSIGGSEKTLINISSELGKFENLIVKVFNLSKKKEIFDSVEWNNISEISFNYTPDFLIAMSDVNLLSLINSKKKFLWAHSVQSFEKFIRKKQFFSFIKNKPLVILEGRYHYKTRSKITSFYGKKILNLAADYDFLNTEGLEVLVIPVNELVHPNHPDILLKNVFREV